MATTNNNNNNDQEAVMPFSMGSPIIVAGPSNCGKTRWVEQLLKRAHYQFEQPPSSILYCYGVFQELFHQMKKEILTPMTLHEGLPTLEHMEEFNDGKFHIIVLDDLMEKIVKSGEVMQLFSMYCHHKNISAILLTQNIFIQGVHSRNISLNTHIFVLFANKRDEQQIHRLGRQLYPLEWRGFVKAYKDATYLGYGYLIVDVAPSTPRQLQLRSQIFSPSHQIVYQVTA